MHHRSVHKLARLECILSCQLQGSPPKLRILVISFTDSDHPIISGRHANGTSGRHPSERVDGGLRNRWSPWAGLCSFSTFAGLRLETTFFCD